MIQSAGELLRLLSNIVKPFRDDPPSLPQLEAAVQDALITALAAKFEMLEGFLSADVGGSVSYVETKRVTDAVVFLSRLLQFDLGLPGVWTQQTREVDDKILNSILSLAMVSNSSQ